MSGDHYEYEVPEADRLRRERQELIGELTVRCGLPSAKTVDGVLSRADFNFSSSRARQDRAKHLKERARTNSDLDWQLVLEEFVQKIFESERTGDPALNLRDVPRSTISEHLSFHGITIPRRHATLWCSPGGSAKSYVLLQYLGTLAQQGLNVALFDWELSEEVHRDRLEQLFGADMPRIWYVRCDRPLVSEADRLSRIVRDHRLDFVGLDSAGFGCDGPPEAAEVALRYFRSLRQTGNVGSIVIAHTTHADEERPFGSVFWWNSARCIWSIKRVDAGENRLQLGFYNKKSNLSRLHHPSSLLATFVENGDHLEHVEFRQADIAESPELSQKLSVRQQMKLLLRRGARTVKDLAEEIDAKPETIERTIRRYKDEFIVLDGGLVGLRERSA